VSVFAEIPSSYFAAIIALIAIGVTLFTPQSPAILTVRGRVDETY
jgi:hypothetical protein